MLFQMAAQQGRSERRGEANSLQYADPLRDMRTSLAAFFNSLLHPAFVEFDGIGPGGYGREG